MSSILVISCLSGSDERDGGSDASSTEDSSSESGFDATIEDSSIKSRFDVSSPMDTSIESSEDSASDADYPQPIPSRQTVTFEVRNDTAGPLYLVNESFRCDTYQIEKSDGSDWEVLRLHRPRHPCYSTIDMQGEIVFQRLLSQESSTVEWDARAIVLFPVAVCPGGYKLPSAGSDGIFRPVDPGEYRVTLGFCFGDRESLCRECTECEDDAGVEPADSVISDYYCIDDGNQDQLNLRTSWFVEPTDMCKSCETIQHTFTLPESGDLTVSVPISADED